MRMVARGVAIVVVAVLAAAGSWRGVGVGAAQGAPVFTVTPAQQMVDLSAGTVTVSIKIADVPAVQTAANGLGSFGFTLRYDAGVLSGPVPQPSDFLGSTGRQITCLAKIDGEAGPGTLQYGCGTLGNGSGPVGDGTLATVTFHLAGGSGTTIAVEAPRVADPSGLPLCRSDGFGNQPVPNDYLLNCAASGAAVTVTGGNASLNQGLSGSPTPAPTSPAPTSEAVQGGSTPQAAATQQPAAAGSVPAADASGNVAAGAPVGSGEVSAGGAVAPPNDGGDTSAVAGASIQPGASGGVGRFGSGTAERHRAGGALVMALMLGGGAFVGAAAAARRPARESGADATDRGRE